MQGEAQNIQKSRKKTTHVDAAFVKLILSFLRYVCYNQRTGHYW
jgi:hypothetical protein